MAEGSEEVSSTISPIVKVGEDPVRVLVKDSPSKELTSPLRVVGVAVAYWVTEPVPVQYRLGKGIMNSSINS
jgi:hypothetical protein